MKVLGSLTKWLLFGVGLAALAGCGRQATVVTGTVSYEGQPVKEGSITFLPADGLGPVCGGTIVDGRYRVEGVPPGRKIAQIVGVKKINFARSSEEMAQLAKEARNRADATGIFDRADTVPADAAGNNAEVQLIVGRQVLDFPLQPAAEKQVANRT